MIARKEKDKQITIKRKTMMVLIFVCVLSYGLFFYQRYQDKALNSYSSGSMEFAFYNGNQKLDTIPLKENGAVFIRSECDNDATVKWDSENWAPAVYNLTEAKTSCTLYFGNKGNNECLIYPESAACKYGEAGETEELLYDDTEDKNLRFVGASPKNYVYFNCEEGKTVSKSTCETWRIIGIMNNIEDEDGYTGSHLKIIRDSIGNYSWDSSYPENSGYGVNEWSQADIEKVLNDEYLNRRNGTNLCYKGKNNDKTTCPDWETIGIRESSRNMIANIKWNTGTMPVAYNSNLITAKYVYEAERNSHNGKELCQLNGGGQYCNDRVSRKTLWTGKVGLMYPSDYGYAVGIEVRDACLEKSMGSYHRDNCITYDWLYDKNNIQFTMTPVPLSSGATDVFYVYSDGHVDYYGANGAYAIRPVLYLTPSVKIIDGNGDINDPFVLEM